MTFLLIYNLICTSEYGPVHIEQIIAIKSYPIILLTPGFAMSLVKDFF